MAHLASTFCRMPLLSVSFACNACSCTWQRGPHFTMDAVKSFCVKLMVRHVRMARTPMLPFSARPKRAISPNVSPSVSCRPAVPATSTSAVPWRSTKNDVSPGWKTKSPLRVTEICTTWFNRASSCTSISCKKGTAVRISKFETSAMSSRIMCAAMSKSRALSSGNSTSSGSKTCWLRTCMSQSCSARTVSACVSGARPKTVISPMARPASTKPTRLPLRSTAARP
mmetsp:Transcript_101071/g.294298  ORF Transcript_101071/g.294298 Transcript_101071/m.294298 type:complete len:226 (-) Transcript_101071:454-1131(-)